MNRIFKCIYTFIVVFDNLKTVESADVGVARSRRLPLLISVSNVVSLLPFLPVDHNITLSLQSIALSSGTWTTPPQSALYPVWSKTGTSLQGFRAEGAPYVDANVTYAWTDAGGCDDQGGGEGVGGEGGARSVRMCRSNSFVFVGHCTSTMLALR